MASRRIARLAAAATTATLLSHHVLAESQTTKAKPKPKFQKPLTEELRAYFVYSACKVPALVDASPWILRSVASVPGLNALSSAFVRRTFYAQFVGGETAQATLPLLRRLRSQNMGCLFAYSVEDEEDGSGGTVASSGYQDRVKETIRCIDVAAGFEDECQSEGRKTWVAIKLSALVPSAEPLQSFSNYLLKTRPRLSAPDVPYPGHARATDLVVLSQPTPTGLSQDELVVLRQLWNDLSRICTHAEKRRVKVIIDAEYSWWQPAIDAYTIGLSRLFNKREALVYGTYQAYLRRTPEQLQHALKDSRKEGYALGVKLVRGAYHPHELERFAKSDSTQLGKAPVWDKIEDTDKTYAICTSMLLDAVAKDVEASRRRMKRLEFWGCPRTSSSSWFAVWPSPQQIGVLFGTHNTQSAAFVLHGLLKRNLAVLPEEEDDDLLLLPFPKPAMDMSKVPRCEIKADVAERVALGQLYGMCDWLTDSLAENVKSPSPFVLKYIPYGELDEVMPYLARRAIENKSVLSGRGGANEELKRSGAELKRRLWGAGAKN